MFDIVPTTDIDFHRISDVAWYEAPETVILRRRRGWVLTAVRKSTIHVSDSFVTNTTRPFTINCASIPSEEANPLPYMAQSHLISKYLRSPNRSARVLVYLRLRGKTNEEDECAATTDNLKNA